MRKEERSELESREGEKEEEVREGEGRQDKESRLSCFLFASLPAYVCTTHMLHLHTHSAHTVWA